ncbi:hypothetical protein MKQ70_10785 [Chitinophaga sedimenti]|uniref:hypothetical protein n=1 Tax=Chitinophaga sedimenti TaxID=2033606 RepID=UPI0020038727|nr:hypothetical protein [Chitinophaga sedimenti]MCK7555464.1 hypothetical protein [Chitinophaga sedimenti]
MMKTKLTIASLLFATTVASAQSPETLTVQAGNIISTVSPTMWGVFSKILIWAPMAVYMQSW